MDIPQVESTLEQDVLNKITHSPHQSEAAAGLLDDLLGFQMLQGVRWLLVDGQDVVPYCQAAI